MKRIILIVPVLLLAACHREGPRLEKALTPVRVTRVDMYQPKSSGRYSASIMPGRQVSETGSPREDERKCPCPKPGLSP